MVQKAVLVGCAQAIAILERDCAFDIVLCDLHMPRVRAPVHGRGLPSYIEKNEHAVSGGRTETGLAHPGTTPTTPNGRALTGGAQRCPVLRLVRRSW